MRLMLAAALFCAIVLGSGLVSAQSSADRIANTKLGDAIVATLAEDDAGAIRLTTDIVAMRGVSNDLLAGAYGIRADVYEKTRKYDLAISDYSNSIRLSPKEPHGYVGRAETYEAAQQYQKAIDDYSVAISLMGPLHTELYRARGFALPETRARGQSSVGLQS